MFLLMFHILSKCSLNSENIFYHDVIFTY